MVKVGYKINTAKRFLINKEERTILTVRWEFLTDVKVYILVVISIIGSY
jgi:hypothetical protein